MAVAEAWTTLAAIAHVDLEHPDRRAGDTARRRRRPWVLARQIATLDQLSGGRLVVGIGLGDDGWREFSAFGEETSPRARGELLDESLERPAAASGRERGQLSRASGYVIDAEPLLPRPVQDPVPIWAAVRWPNKQAAGPGGPVAGLLPDLRGLRADVPAPPPVADLTALRAELTALGAPRSLDVAVRCAAHRLHARGAR